MVRTVVESLSDKSKLLSCEQEGWASSATACTVLSVEFPAFARTTSSCGSIADRAAGSEVVERRDNKSILLLSKETSRWPDATLLAASSTKVPALARTTSARLAEVRAVVTEVGWDAVSTQRQE